MTTHALLTLIAASSLKGAIFGALFGWLFPRANRMLARRLGRDAGTLRPAAFASRATFGLAVLSGSGFALIDLMGLVSDAAGLPELLRWAMAALFAACAFGTVLIISATPRQTGSAKPSGAES
jgi:hypothetical protein